MRKRNLGRVTALAVLIAVMMLTMFTACGSGKAATDSDSKGGGQTSDSAPVPASADTYSDAPGSADMDAAGDVTTLEEEASPSLAGAPEGAAPGNQSGASADKSRKITFSASYSISTKNYDKDYAAIYNLTDKANGYIANEESYTPPSYDGIAEPRSSSLSLRIPIAGFDTFMKDLEGVGEVTNKNKSSEDLTSRYFDTESRIELLEMRKTRLMEYIKNAKKASDIVDFESELSDVLYELDQYQGEKRGLDQLLDYATIDVNLNEEITPETIGHDGKPLGDRAGNAFSMSIQGIKIFFGNLFVFLAGALPILFILAVAAVIALLIVRTIKRRRKNRKDLREQKAEPDSD